MKILTTNFLTCAVKTCKTSPLSFPLHFKDATLERTEIDFNPLFLRNVLPRVNWEALTTTAAELGLQALVPERNPVDVVADGAAEEEQEGSRKDTEMDVELQQQQDQQETNNAQSGSDDNGNDDSEEVLKKLHGLLLETAVVEGKLVCGNCGFEYPIKEGVGNFLLPAHLV
jgi:multifunctional methyltransferase subunit TRM112